MPNRPLGRVERLRKIENLLFQHPQGMRVVEIARACGVDRRTVYRDLDALEGSGVPIVQKSGRYGLVRDQFQATLQFSYNEAVIMFLATRLLAACIAVYNPHLLTVLAKLGKVMAEPVSSHLALVASEHSAAPANARLAHVLEVVASAWLHRRKVRLWVENALQGGVTLRVLSPYLLEPTVQGELYVVGQDETSGKIRSLSLRTVQRAQVLDLASEADARFSPGAYLAPVWSMPGSDNVQTVVLHFDPEAALQVRSRRWHASQRIEDLANGGCRLTVAVDDWRTMCPWIRSWGAQVEVVSPRALREAMADEAVRLATIYHESVEKTPA